MFGLIMRYIPSIRLPWKDIGVGAALTAVTFTLGKTAIGVYLGKASVGSAYGAAGSQSDLAWPRCHPEAPGLCHADARREGPAYE